MHHPTAEVRSSQISDELVLPRLRDASVAHNGKYFRRVIPDVKLGKNGRRNDHLLKQSREYRIDAAQDEIVQRRGIRDDDAHERGRIFSNVAASASRSEAK